MLNVSYRLPGNPSLAHKRDEHDGVAHAYACRLLVNASSDITFERKETNEVILRELRSRTKRGNRHAVPAGSCGCGGVW
jgi:hypothetical protein